MKYKEEYPSVLRDYANEHEFFSGSISDVGKVFGVDRGTIYDWMRKYPKFNSAIEEIRTICDDKIENALYKSALGYSCEEKRLIKDGVGPDAQVIQAQVIQRQVPPNPVCQKFWLINRRGSIWREKQELQTQGSITVVFEEGDDAVL